MSMFDTREHLNAAFGAYLEAYESTSVIRDQHLIGGGAISELEAKIREYYGFEYVLLTSNGTSALLITALALNLKAAAFVTSVYGYGATLSTWLLLGNNPIFVDVNDRTLTIDPTKVGNAVTGNAQAILSTDLFGVPSDTEAIRELANRFGLWYVADSCQAFGAVRGGKAASHLADVAVVSFTSGKSLAVGEGGAVLTNNGDIYRRLLWFGQHPYRQKRELGISVFNPYAVNARIHPLAAVWGNSIFEEALERVLQKQDLYLKAISILNESGLITPLEFGRTSLLPAFFRLTVEPKVDVSFVIEHLRCFGFRATATELPAMLFHRSDILAEQLGKTIDPNVSFPVAERAAEKRIALTLVEKDG
jgi:perosamine synthetase